MSFTTRCPACGTMFRVVADQLKISDGWVRCGHCSDVFDATLNLDAWVPPLSAEASAAVPTVPGPSPTLPLPQLQPEPLSLATTSASPTPESGEDAMETRVPDDDIHAWFGDEPLPPGPGPQTVSKASAAPSLTTQPRALEEEATAEAVVGESPAVDPDFHAELQQFASATGRASGPAGLTVMPGLTTESAGTSAAPDQTLAAAPHPFPDPDPATDVPGFVRQARRRAFWSSAGVRMGLGVVTLLLGCLLAAQWILQERHRLVVSQPALKPWIEQACGWVGCSIEPLRRIDAVVIDSSDLVRRLGNFYSFDLVVRNTATIDVAVPALELTLTDSSDAVIARRVFLPREWPNSPSVLPASGDLAVSFRLSLTLGESSTMAGYRALVFYP